MSSTANSSVDPHSTFHFLSEIGIEATDIAMSIDNKNNDKKKNYREYVNNYKKAVDESGIFGNFALQFTSAVRLLNLFLQNCKMKTIDGRTLLDIILLRSRSRSSPHIRWIQSYLEPSMPATRNLELEGKSESRKQGPKQRGKDGKAGPSAQDLTKNPPTATMNPSAINIVHDKRSDRDRALQRDIFSSILKFDSEAETRELEKAHKSDGFSSIHKLGSKAIEEAIPEDASSIFHIYGRRIDMNAFSKDSTVYELARAWIQDDPYRYVERDDMDLELLTQEESFKPSAVVQPATNSTEAARSAPSVDVNLRDQVAKSKSSFEHLKLDFSFRCKVAKRRAAPKRRNVRLEDRKARIRLKNRGILL